MLMAVSKRSGTNTVEQSMLKERHAGSSGWAATTNGARHPAITPVKITAMINLFALS
jgi:hypothetical protein